MKFHVELQNEDHGAQQQVHVEAHVKITEGSLKFM